MELGVRDWMIIVGVLLILAVLLDGYRRVRNERRGKIRMSLNKRFLNASDDLEEEVPTSELPNGGARVIGRAGAGSLKERREPQLGDTSDLALDQSVPLLMESVISANLAGELAEDYDDPHHDDLFSQSDDDRDPVTAAAEASPGDVDASQPTAADKPRSPEDVARAPRPRSEKAPEAGSTSGHRGAQEIVVINVIARDQPFKGADLLHILLACDLRFGKMNIFHRHEQANGRGQVQFSVANSVEPGTFNLDNIDDFSTPGVCFFMSVPGPEDPITAFECMVETAHCLVKNLDGEMRDESRSVMTMQTLEHCRQRLQEFERRQLAQA